tara:strand:- start:333 stop:542 length:210 start_codon:yes stop_codon:yes gene_type:complete
MMEKNMTNTKLTSVKILKILYEDFRVKTINSNMNLQKLTNRAIDMYLTDEEFRNDLETHENLTISGSNF